MGFNYIPHDVIIISVFVFSDKMVRAGIEDISDWMLIMDDIKVSVVIPYYNNVDTIRKAVNSVASKKYRYEIILVDASKSFDAEHFGLSHVEGFRVVSAEEKLDVARARNLGTKEAMGEYIAFLDADDWWEYGKLDKQLQIMEDKKTDEKGRDIRLCFTARRLCSEDGRRTRKVIDAPEKVTYKKLLLSNFISCSSVLLPRSVAADYPMKSGKLHEDYLCWLEILRDGGIAYGINEPLLDYRSYRASRSGKKLNSALMTYRVYKNAGLPVWKRLLHMATYTFYGVRKYM